MVLIKSEEFDDLIVRLNLSINHELDLAQKEKKNIKSIEVKRIGKDFKVSYWHGDRFT